MFLPDDQKVKILQFAVRVDTTIVLKMLNHLNLIYRSRIALKIFQD